MWPRGISKEAAGLDEWNKNLAPSPELRNRFHHGLESWDTFSEKYRQELLTENPGEEFLNRLAKEEKISLVYAAKDEKHCHALGPKQYLENLIGNLENGGS